MDNVTLNLSMNIDGNAELPVGLGVLRVNAFLETTYWQRDRSALPADERSLVYNFSTSLDHAYFDFLIPGILI